MSITKATLSDVPQLNTLVNSAYRGEISRKGWTTEADLLDGLRIDEATLTGYFENPGIILLKNSDETGQITGCVYLEQRKSTLYVGMFSVMPHLQNKGVGTHLLLAAEAYAKQLSCNTLTMTVISARHELIGWYERKGYRATGETQPFPTDTKFGLPKQSLEFIVMEKHI